MTGYHHDYKATTAGFLRLIDLARSCRASLFFSTTRCRGWSALHFASLYLKPEHCDLFFTRGADPANVAFGWSVTHNVAMYVGVGDVRVREACAIVILAEWGVNLDTRDTYGRIPLDNACLFGKCGRF